MVEAAFVRLWIRGSDALDIARFGHRHLHVGSLPDGAAERRRGPTSER